LVLVFVTTVFAAGLLASLLGRLSKAAGLDGVDRTLGALFGLCRGVLAVIVLTLVAGLTHLTAEPAWKQALLVPHVTAVIETVKPWLPDKVQSLVQTASSS
jgi:membrane protein required for colicin V production